MKIESARERQRQLNAQLRLKREEERRFQFEQQGKDLNMKYLAAFPESFCADFEKRFVFGRSPSPAYRKSNRACWTAAQKLILHLKLDPSEWFDSAFNFYDYFFEKARSLSYISKVLRFTNLWGYFLCRRLGLPFLPVPTPNGYERNRILDAYFRKLDGKRRRSEPITPDQLTQAKRKLKAKHYQWIYLSVWAGLRPLEIDQLKDKAHYLIKKLSDGTLVLWVYQTKLVSLPPWERWKLIPLLFPEQNAIPNIIRKGAFERPNFKVMKKHFGKDTGLYGGRKGFTDLMLERSQSLESISQWMGHSSIERTWKNYKNRRRTHYRRVV
jgi:hypothetical protein